MVKYLNCYGPDFSQRDAHPLVDELFVQRWSPRSFTKTPIAPEDLATIIEAARWAPSAYNEQPWRILTSTEESFATFLELLVESNQRWAKDASVLGFLMAKKNFTLNGQPNPWAQFDCGAAWMSLTLQARKLGLYTHGMAGIKKEEIYKVFQINQDEYQVMAGFAMGVLGQRDNLDPPYFDWETPSSRKTIQEIWQEDRWSE